MNILDNKYLYTIIIKKKAAFQRPTSENPAFWEELEIHALVLSARDEKTGSMIVPCYFLKHSNPPSVPSFHLLCADDCGRKFLVHRKAGFSGNSKAGRMQKNAPNLTIRSIFVLFVEEISPSGFPQQPQPRKRSYRPWGCCLRLGSPSFPRQIRLTAALCLRCRDFWRRNPDLSQNKKHIT